MVQLTISVVSQINYRDYGTIHLIECDPIKQSYICRGIIHLIGCGSIQYIDYGTIHHTGFGAI